MNINKKMKRPPDNGFRENGFAQTIWQHQSTLIRFPMKISHILKTKTFQIIKTVNAKHCVTALILLTLGTIIYYTHYVETSPFIG